MKIWVDGDSCPAKIRSILSKRCEKEGIPLFFLSNRSLPEASSAYGEFLIVEGRTVDQELLHQVSPQEWVLTRDFPLAQKILEKGAFSFNDRGRAFTLEEIKNRIKERDLMEALRKGGQFPYRGKSFGAKEVHEFAAFLDSLVLKLKK